MESEIQNTEPKQAHPAFQVTTLSKCLALVLFVLLPFLGGYIGYTYAPEKVVEVEKVVIKEIPKVDSSQTEVMDIPAAYDSSAYRVVAVVQNPYYSDQSKYDTLVIAAPRGINDYSCGGRYVPSTCYIFLESSYAETETPKFVGTWDSGFIETETIEFTSPTELSIGVANGDGCSSYKAEWKYDLNTGSSTLVSSEDLSTC